MTTSDVCEVCGWYNNFNHAARCSKARGERADRLAASTTIKSTKLGYGDDRLTFKIAEKVTLSFRVSERGYPFYVEDLYLIRNLDQATAKRLVEGIAAALDPQPELTGEEREALGELLASRRLSVIQHQALDRLLNAKPSP